MIIKTSRLKAFQEEYDRLIGTEYDWEEWDEGTTHVFGFDIETVEEQTLFDKLYQEYDEFIGKV